jgi:hypothetical protein
MTKEETFVLAIKINLCFSLQAGRRIKGKKMFEINLGRHKTKLD